MIHARIDGTYTVSVIDKQRMYAFIADVDSLADANHIERALKLTMQPQGTRQPGPCIPRCVGCVACSGGTA